MDPSPDGCPLHYKRQSVADIRAGEVPYLLGGPQRPCCRNCLNNTRDSNGFSWPAFCRFESDAGAICPAHLREEMIQSYLARGYDGPLTLTPCDLWPFIRNRTTWILGDSQSLDFYKVCQLQPCSGARPRAPGATGGRQRPRSETPAPQCMTSGCHAGSDVFYVRDVGREPEEHWDAGCRRTQNHERGAAAIVRRAAARHAHLLRPRGYGGLVAAVLGRAGAGRVDDNRRRRSAAAGPGAGGPSDASL